MCVIVLCILLKRKVKEMLTTVSGLTDDYARVCVYVRACVRACVVCVCVCVCVCMCVCVCLCVCVCVCDCFVFGNEFSFT